MAQKSKLNTRIPTIPRAQIPVPKPTIQQNTSSSLHLNSIGNTALQSTKLFGNSVHQSTKLPPVTRAPRMRRSKSVTDFRSNITTTRKRPGVPEFNPISNKIAKVTKPVLEKPAKPIVPKIPPYDFKARYYQLKEKDDKIKISLQETTIKKDFAEKQNEYLLPKNKQLQSDLNAAQVLIEKLTKSEHELKEQKETSNQLIHNLQTKSDELEEILKVKTVLIEKLTKSEHELNEHKESSTQLIQNLQTKSDEFEKLLKAKTELLESNTEELNELKEIHDKIQSKLSSALKQLEETLGLNTFMKKELLLLQDDKRKLHNMVQELKGNIRVFCRIRPPLFNEKDKLLYNITYLDESSIDIYRTKDKKLEYSFDKVFGPNSTQEDIFEELAQLVQSAVDGYNVCVFAYGQTGSGKTYTMEGEDEFAERGMIPRSVDTIFKTLENMKRLGWVYIIKASFLEIYNENIVDLLDSKKTNLDIRMCDAKGSDVHVPNLTIEKISTADKLKKLMKIAQRNRAVAATENNERSSRSHSVIKINLEGIQVERGQKCIGNLNLIDLAGSEKFHTNETVRFRETTNINKSLSNLSNVILSLVQKKSHIPYRNSKLTHLLMPALGGNSKTLMLVNISPIDDCYNESVNSLRFASTVNQCKTGSIKKQKLQT